MKRLIFILITLLFSCSPKLTVIEFEKPSDEFIQYELNSLKDTIYSGRVHWIHTWELDSQTFIVADSINVMVKGIYNIEKGTEIYVVYPDSSHSRRKATIIWKTDLDEHEIIR